MILDTGETIHNVIEGSGNDALTLNDLNDTITVGSGNDTITAGLGQDTFVFNANAPMGSDIINATNRTINGAGGGIDTLDFSGTTAAVTVDLGSTAAQVVNANLTLTLAGGNTVANVIGGSGANQLTGNIGNNVLTAGPSRQYARRRRRRRHLRLQRRQGSRRHDHRR